MAGAVYKPVLVMVPAEAVQLTPEVRTCEVGAATATKFSVPAGGRFATRGWTSRLDTWSGGGVGVTPFEHPKAVMPGSARAQRSLQRSSGTALIMFS